jgi:hypothetical protein
MISDYRYRNQSYSPSLAFIAKTIGSSFRAIVLINVPVNDLLVTPETSTQLCIISLHRYRLPKTLTAPQQWL